MRRLPIASVVFPYGALRDISKPMRVRVGGIQVDIPVVRVSTCGERLVDEWRGLEMEKLEEGL